MSHGLEWRLAFRNLLRNKRRTLSTSFGLVIAFVGISLLAGHLYKTDQAMKALTIYIFHVGHFQIAKTGSVEHRETVSSKFLLNDPDSQEVLKILKSHDSDLEFVAGLLSTEALLSTGASSIPVWVQGFPPELDDFVYQHPLVRRWQPNLIKAREGQSMAVAAQHWPDSISISHGVSELLNRSQKIEKMSEKDRELSIAARTLDNDLNAVNATISLKHTTGMPYVEDVSVLAPLGLVQELINTKGVTNYSVFLKQGADEFAVMSRLKDEFKEKGLNVELLRFDDERVGEYYNSTMSFLLSMGVIIGALILSAAGFIVMNSITMAAMERLREMGTMRAMGYLPERIRSLFVKEAICISIFSCLAGVLISELLSLLINNLKIEYKAPGFSVGIPLELISPPYFYLSLVPCMVGVSAAISLTVLTRKSKEPITVLLSESGASA